MLDLLHEQCGRRQIRGDAMSLGLILLIVLVVALVGAVPAWPYSSSWGYAPSGVAGLVLLLVILLLVTGRI
jgi:hypothetical protein